MADIRAVIFDWGGVIASEALWDWVRKHVRDAESKREAFQAEIDRENVGASAPDTLISFFAKESGMAVENVLSSLNLERTIRPEMVLLLQRLKPNYKIGLLSNASGFLNTLIAENGLTELFDAVVISAEVRVIKPDPRIYTITLEKLGVSAPESVFVDDRIKNVEGANAVGMRGILFSDTASLEGELTRLGVTI